MNSGEYTAPLVRTTTVQVPVINGYSTARLRAQDDLASTTSALDQSVEVLLENTGDTQVTIQLLEMSIYDATAESPNQRDETNIGAAKVVKPKGRLTYTIVPVKRYLEVKCTAGGPSNVRVQLTGQIKWQELGFDKTKDNTIYPKSLWQANIPAWGSLSP